jgi:hypothetical protein
VFTLAGERDALSRHPGDGVVAVRTIDLRTHRGEHLAWAPSTSCPFIRSLTRR